MKVTKKRGEDEMKYNINPYVRRAWHHNLNSNIVIERVIFDHEIIYIDSGKLKLTIDKKIYYVNEGSCIILPPNVQHKIEGIDDSTWQPHVHFDFYELPDSDEVPVSFKTLNNMEEKEKKYMRKNFFLEHKIHIPYVVKLKNPTRVRQILFKIIETHTQQNIFSDLILKGLIIDLVATILTDYHTSQGAYSDKTRKINELISHVINNINHDYTLEEMAKITNLTIWNLIQTFNKMYNTTPKKFFEKYRILHAKTLLEVENMAIKEIAYQMEFDSPQTFSRWFKKIDGKNPTFYKKKTTNVINKNFD